MPPRSKPVTTRNFFSAHGPLSTWHPNFEFRPGQLEMALEVEAAFKDKKHLIVEAGTGTGKTLAYLVPSLLSGRRIGSRRVWFCIIIALTNIKWCAINRIAGQNRENIQSL